MATHSGVLAWRIPGTAGPGGLPSMGSHRVGHERLKRLSSSSSSSRNSIILARKIPQTEKPGGLQSMACQ